MKKNKSNEKIRKAGGVGKWLYWTPRILSIIFLLFLAMFSLDIFDSCNNFLNCSLGLFMHNLPVIVLAVLLWISWKHEIVGAVAWILAGLLYIARTIITMVINGFEPYYLVWILQISGIAFLIGILFLIGWRRKRKKK
jgi:ABC-type multidrug transport system permease subunit